MEQEEHSDDAGRGALGLVAAEKGQGEAACIPRDMAIEGAG